MTESVGCTETRMRYDAALAALPEDQDGVRHAFALGFEAALREIERCAIHWGHFPLNGQGRTAVNGMREAVRVTREGWDCAEAQHSGCRRDEAQAR
jgi:hypothetical protein